MKREPKSDERGWPLFEKILPIESYTNRMYTLRSRDSNSFMFVPFVGGFTLKNLNEGFKRHNLLGFFNGRISKSLRVSNNRLLYKF